MKQKTRLKQYIKDQLLGREDLIGQLAHLAQYSNSITVKNYIKKDLEKLTLPTFQLYIKQVLGIAEEEIIIEFYTVENTDFLHE